MDWFSVVLFSSLIVTTVFEIVQRYKSDKEFRALMKKEHDERVRRFWNRKDK